MEVSIKEEPLDWTPEVSEAPAEDPLSNLPLSSIFSPETQEKPPKELNDKQLASLTCQFCNKLYQPFIRKSDTNANIVSKISIRNRP